MYLRGRGNLLNFAASRVADAQSLHKNPECGTTEWKTRNGGTENLEPYKETQNESYNLGHNWLRLFSPYRKFTYFYDKLNPC